MKKDAKVKQLKNKNFIRIYLNNTQDVLGLLKLIFPEVIRVLKIERHGNLYLVKVKGVHMKAHYLAITSIKKEVKNFKLNTQENCEKESGLILENISFNLGKPATKKACGISPIQTMNGIYLLLFYFNLDRKRVNTILKSSF